MSTERLVAEDIPPSELPWDRHVKVRTIMRGKRILSVETSPGVMSHATFVRWDDGEWRCEKAYENMPFVAGTPSALAMHLVREMPFQGSSFWT